LIAYVKRAGEGPVGVEELPSLGGLLPGNDEGVVARLGDGLVMAESDAEAGAAEPVREADAYDGGAPTSE
jgi:hypothetical protein